MEIYTLTDLLNSDLKPERVIVNDLFIGNTVSILSADPKIGKTSLAIQLADAISRGKDILGKKTTKNVVTYFSIDNNEQLIKSRLNKMGIKENDNVSFIFLNPCSMEEIIGYITDLKNQNPKLGFVIIDMLNDIRTIDATNEYSNAVIKKDLNTLKIIAEKLKIGILVLHHNRKGDAKNKNNKILGGIQLTGSINGSILALYRESTQATDALLEISGKNVSSNTIGLEFQKEKISFKVLDKPFDELEVDLVKIINNIFLKGDFVGSVQELCAATNIVTDPRKIGKLIRNNEKGFEENGIHVKWRKSNGKRYIELSVDSTFEYSKGPLETSFNVAITNGPMTLERGK